MSLPLRLLMVEDSENDAELLVRELRRGGYAVSFERVQTPSSLEAALARQPWDLIVSDCAMPGFGAAPALAMVQKSGLDVPFLVLSGTIDEDEAVNLLRSGAKDFLTKSRMARLLPAVQRELSEKAVRDEARHSQSQIRVSEDRFRIVLEAAPDGMVLVRADGAIAFVNAQTELMFGYPRAQLVGQSIEVLVAERFREMLRDNRIRLLQPAAAAPAVATIDLAGRSRNGDEFPAEMRLSCSRTEEGDVITVAIRDVTERNRAAEQRQRLVEQVCQAQKIEAVGVLAGGLAHDFNNVLSVILSYAEFLGDALATDASLRSDVDEIKSAADRAVQLTRQLLAFSRRRPVTPIVVDLNVLVSGIERMLRRLVGERVEVAIVPGAALRSVRIDPGQMEQVLMNLAVNARDAMPSGGRVVVRTDNVDAPLDAVTRYPGLAPGAYVEVSVSDTGFGMDAETVGRIFEPFFTTKELGKGTGLGLSVVHGIVEQAGGHVAVESEKGKGTTFRILLPATEESADQLLQREAGAPVGGSETILLVVVDDHVRAAVALLLRRKGYEVLDVHSAGEALLVAEERPGTIQLLLTDLSMPRMSGDELAERVARTQPKIGVVLIADTTESTSLASKGGPSLVSKPIRPESLLEEVRAALDRRADPQERPATPAPGSSQAALKVLVVDADPARREAFGKILSTAGYSVETATSGSAAEAQLQKGGFDAVVTDVAMSDMTGLDLLRRARAKNLDTPVILAASSASPSAASAAAAASAFRYLAEPAPDEGLLDAVAQAAKFGRLGNVRREATRILGRDDDWRTDRASLKGVFESALDHVWVAFQPIVSLKRRGVVGYEALVRSNDPKLRSPGDLFGAAARLGRLQELGRIVRARVAAAAANAPPDTTLFVNVHTEELNDFDLWASGAPLSRMARRVFLEVTERAVLDSVGLRAKVSNLRRLGFRIAVDDVGAGYGGLASFSALEPDAVKLDSSLIHHIDASSQRRSVVQSMIQLAVRDPNILVICEGVERAAERDVLDGMGADLMQGYLFGRPTNHFTQHGEGLERDPPSKSESTTGQHRG